MNSREEEIFEQHMGKHDFLAEGLLAPFNNQTDANRMQMFNSHSGQLIQLKESEFPLVFTGFENQIGNYSTGYKYNETDKLVIKKFIKNDHTYFLLVQDIKTKEYDIIERKEAEVLTEYFGYKNDNSVLDSINEGDLIEGDTVLSHDMNYDDELNFKYGKNLNVAYISYKAYTNEDSLVVSESTAKAMSSYFCQEIEVNINTNDILLNMYGDENNYQTFPKIGDTVREDGILLAMRRINFNDIINKLRDDQLTKNLEDDRIIFADHGAKVIDIDIFSNNSIDNLKKETYNCQVYEEYSKLKEFYADVVKTLKPILEKKNVKFTSDLRNFYNVYASYNDPLTEFENNGQRFDNLVIRFKVLFEKELNEGVKATNRYGGKGIVAKIVPDEEMPVLNQIGDTRIDPNSSVKMRADVCINPLGVFNRLTSGDLKSF